MMAAEQSPDVGLTPDEITTAVRLAAELCMFLEDSEARFIRSGFLIHCMIEGYRVRPEARSLVARHLGTAFSALHVCSEVFGHETVERGES